VTERIVITGASGFLGESLTAAFRAEGAEVARVGRSGPDGRWGDTDGLTRLVDGASLVVNLAGKSVNCRYGPENRAEILRSRVETTRELGVAIARAAAPPPLWVNSSTATIYRHAEDRPMTESTGELGTGFSVSIAKAWEAELDAADVPDTRRVALRMAIVLGDGSALLPLLGLARAGLGGPQLDGVWPSTRARRDAGTYHENRRTHGHQRFSWIHEDDVHGIIRFLQQHPELDGAINAASPEPRDDAELMRILRAEQGAPFGLPTWRWMLELGSFALRTETELVLKSRWVVPERLTAAGYEFRYPRLEDAVHEIVERRRGGRSGRRATAA
jgi:uncharacterized protein